MADSLSLELEIKAQFDSVRKALEELRNQVKSNLGEAMKSASASGAQLRDVLRDVSLGFQRLFSGNTLSGLRSIGQAFTDATDKATGFAGQLGALGPIAIAVGIAVVAALVAIKVAYEALTAVAGKMLDLAKKIGTESQEAFAKMKQALEGVGGGLTFIDQLLSQNLLRAVARLQSAFDLLWQQVLRESGPELIKLLNTLTELLVAMAPVAKTLAEFITVNFKAMTIAINLAVEAARRFVELSKGLPLGILTPSTPTQNIKRSPLKTGSGSDFLDPDATVLVDPEKTEKRARAARSAAEDMTALELALNRLQRTSEDTRDAFGASLDAIRENFRSGGITAEEFFKQVVDEEQKFVAQQRDLIAEERKLINARPALPRQRQNELEELAAKEKTILNASNARVIEADRLATEAREKLTEKEKAALEKSKEEWSKYANHVTEQLIKIHNQEVDNQEERERIRQANEAAANEEIQRQIQQADPTSNVNIFGVDPTGEMTRLDAFKSAALGSLTDLKNSVGNLGQFMTRSLMAVAGATQQVLTNFILTGKFGAAAFKSLAASIIASLIVTAGVNAIFEVAEGIKETALASASAAVGDVKGAALHTKSAAEHFVAAKFYGVLAGGAAIAGAVLGGTAGGGGGGAAGSSSNGQQQGAKEIQINRGDISGQVGGEGTWFHGMVKAWDRQAAATEALHAKITGMSPGDVLTRGVDQNPAAVAKGVRSSLQTDAGFIRNLGLSIERG